MFHTNNKKHRNTRSGFTLIELMVTVGIFVLLSTVALVNFRQVDNSLILQNVAHQVALVVRKAQISGISVQGIKSGTSTVFPSYGVNFDITGPPPHNFFRLFADLPTGLGNGVFNGIACPGAIVLGDECVQKYTLAEGYTIKELWGDKKTTPPGTSLTNLDITFRRPNPDALMIGNTGTPPSGFSDGEIVIQSRLGQTKTIIIWKTGQISIE